MALANIERDLEGARPWDIDNRALESTTEWNRYVAPRWTRQAVVKNTDATHPLYVGGQGVAGVVDLAAQRHTVLAPGESICLTLSEGRSRPTDASREISLASTTASHSFSVVMAAWSAS